MQTRRFVYIFAAIALMRVDGGDASTSGASSARPTASIATIDRVCFSDSAEDALRMSSRATLSRRGSVSRRSIISIVATYNKL